MLGLLHIPEGVKITPILNREMLAYRLSPGARGAGAVLPPSAVAVLLLADGKRTLSAVYNGLRELGIPMDEPVRLLALVKDLEAAGIVEVNHHFLYREEGLEHRCLGCGQSCEGHLVGPIEDEEAKELERRLQDLRALETGVPDGPATTEICFDGALKRVLHFPENRCVFLNEERRCRLHGRWGAGSKPLACRMFPYKMIMTEAGTRVVKVAKCFHSQEQQEEGGTKTPGDLLKEWQVWRPPAVYMGADPEQSSSFKESEAALQNRREERDWLEHLDGGYSFAERLFPSAESGSNQARFVSRRKAFREASVQLLKAHFSHYTEAWYREANQTGFGAHLATFVKGVLAFNIKDLNGLDETPPGISLYCEQALRDWIFAREWAVAGTVSDGVVLYSLGAYGAWLMAGGVDRKPDVGTYGRYLSCWLRYISVPETFHLIRGDGKAWRSLLSLLA